MKYAENGQFDVACKGALKQIEEKKYETKLKEDGMNTIVFGREKGEKSEGCGISWYCLRYAVNDGKVRAGK